MKGGMTVTSRSASGNGSGRSHNALTTVKTTRLTPTATAAVIVANVK